VWFSSDPPPPLLTPVTPTGMSVESGKGEALVMGVDSEGSEPPKLTMVNGDLGKLKTGKLQSYSCNICSILLFNRGLFKT
jgi:hypothetical protein